MARLILLMGLPGSGKSTYAKDYLEDHIENTVWCSSDSMRKELYGDESIQGNANTVFTKLHTKVTHYLNQNYNVLYDATNVTRKSRRTIIRLAKTLGAEIHGVVVWATLEECLDRDKSRDRTVGYEVIDKFVKRWESPYYDEGFDSLQITYNSKIWPIEYMNKLRDSMKIPHDNSHHSADVYEHCCIAEELMMNEVGGNGELQFIMKWHDCGKPYTKFFKEDNPTHAHYYNHNNVGGYLIYGLWAGLEEECLDNILFTSWAISNHMEPFFNSTYYKTMPLELKEKIDLIHKCDKAAH